MMSAGLKLNTSVTADSMASSEMPSMAVPKVLTHTLTGSGKPIA